MRFELYHGDALQVLKDIPDNSVDLLLTDPPYNISQKHNKKLKIRRKPIKLNFGDWDFFSEEDFYKFTSDWFGEAVKKLKPNGSVVVFFSMERIGYFTIPINGLFVKNGIKFKTIVVWHKNNPVPQFFKNGFISSNELIVVGTKGTSIIKNYLGHTQMQNFFTTNVTSNYKVTDHPTEKPESLVRWLIRILTNKDDVILDPFLGSGTTMVSALKEGRSCIGIEKDEKYINTIKKRMNWGYSLDPQIEFIFKNYEVSTNGETIIR